MYFLLIQKQKTVIFKKKKNKGPKNDTNIQKEVFYTSTNLFLSALQQEQRGFSWKAVWLLLVIVLLARALGAIALQPIYEKKNTNIRK